MTIDGLIELAQDAREDLGGDAQVRIAYQPGYPLRAALGFVTVPPSTDPSGLYRPRRDHRRAAGRRHVPVARHGATSPAGRTPTPPSGSGPAPASPPRSNGDKQPRLAPGLLLPHRSRLPRPGRLVHAGIPPEPALVASGYATPEKKSPTRLPACSPASWAPPRRPLKVSAMRTVLDDLPADHLLLS